MKYYLVLIFMLLALAGCSDDSDDDMYEPADSLNEHLKALNLPEEASIDLDAIKKRGKLIALTRYNANSYFIYRGKPMGYEYELLKLFADELGVDLEVKTPRTWDSLFIMLNNGDGDLIAANLTVTLPRLKLLKFTDHHSTTTQVLVQKKPDNWRKMKLHEIKKELIRNPIDLIGKEVTVRKSSSYYHRLKNLSSEIGGKILIQAAPEDHETSKLIEQVSTGEIQYTVADKNIALLNKAYISNIDVKTQISFPQRLAWAVRKSSTALLTTVNDWIQKMRTAKDPTYYVIYNKYYKNTNTFKRRIKSETFTLRSGKISEYDQLFKKASANTAFDWRLIASQAFQESRFDPETQSWAGALGLMQLMPATAKELGVSDLTNPKNSINAGVKYLQKLSKHYWKDLPEEERIKFTLASYNAGAGHILDAQRLTEKYNKDPEKWSDVSEFVLKLKEEKYYYDPVVKHGYCRGDEPYLYVKEILERFELYKNVVK